MAWELKSLVVKAQYRAFADKIPAFYWALIVGMSIVAEPDNGDELCEQAGYAL